MPNTAVLYIDDVFINTWTGSSYGYTLPEEYIPTLSSEAGEFLGYFIESAWGYTGGEQVTSETVFTNDDTPIYLYTKWNWYDFLISGETLKKLGDAARKKTGETETTYTLDKIRSLVQRIVFTVNGTAYYCEAGMTWEEFVNSSYNTGPFAVYSYGTTVSMGGETSVSGVIKTDVIVEGTAYVSKCCFVAGTQVTISLDGASRNIEEMRPGDDVLAYDVESGTNYIAKVQKLIIHPDSTDMARVEFENGSFLDMRSYHPIYTRDGFRSILASGSDKLTVGCEAKTLDGWSKITKIIEYDLREGIDTYTLAVIDNDEIVDDDTNDDFYANGVVVHNAPACSFT